MQKNSGHIDWIIMLAVAGLMLFSIAFVYSASASFADVKFGSSAKLFWNHAIRVLLGLIVMISFAKIDYHRWRSMSKPVLLVAIGFLFLVFVIGTHAKGASRWIHLGPLNFQPSEFAKFALVLHLTSLLSTRQEYIKDFRYGLMPLLLWVGGVCVLIALQPNFSTALAIFLISSLILFIGNASIKQMAIIAGFSSLVGGAYAVSAQYRVNRLMTFIGKGTGAKAEAVKYQLDQALLAFGNGGIMGVGPGQSRQRDWFLPESYGDFIFSIVGEEYGFIGVMLVMSAFAVIVWRGLMVARRAPDDFGYFLAAGITFTLALYAFINAGVTCGILPTTGLPMPFISYGGSSVFFSAAAVGMLLNISAQAGVYPRRQIL